MYALYTKHLRRSLHTKCVHGMVEVQCQASVHEHCSTAALQSQSQLLVQAVALVSDTAYPPTLCTLVLETHLLGCCIVPTMNTAPKLLCITGVSCLCRLLQPGGMFVGISYGSPSSRLPCFLNSDFGWDPLVYTIQRPESTSPAVSQCVMPKAACISGPYTPRVSAKTLTCHNHVFVCL